MNKIFIQHIVLEINVDPIQYRSRVSFNNLVAKHIVQ